MLRSGICVGLLGICVTGVLAQPADGEPAADAPGYSRGGADSCLRCHDTPQVMSIFETPHGHRTDPGSPFAQLQCESCHGPGEAHAGRVRRGETRPSILNFGRTEPTLVSEQNAICLDCHRDDVGLGWHSGLHGSSDVGCADCHTVHAGDDPMQIASEQPQKCYDCHRRQRSDSFKPSVHPIRYGKMACTACHDPHQSNNEFMLVESTLNQTCYGCHAEKRGPFLWEHAPVAEDCSLCHTAHGSNHPALLHRRPPLLCQQCHSQQGHPSVAFTGRGLADGTPSAFLLGSSCMNCHSQVHGSNHPSGPRLTR